jgi:hypothetical protein
MYAARQVARKHERRVTFRAIRGRLPFLNASKAKAFVQAGYLKSKTPT